MIKDKKGYRVAHCQAIDDIYWWHTDEELSKWKKTDKINPKEVDKKFGVDKYFKTKEEAYKEADRIYKEIMDSEFPIVEYGIQYLGEIK